MIFNHHLLKQNEKWYTTLISMKSENELFCISFKIRLNYIKGDILTLWEPQDPIRSQFLTVNIIACLNASNIRFS